MSTSDDEYSNGWGWLKKYLRESSEEEPAENIIDTIQYKGFEVTAELYRLGPKRWRGRVEIIREGTRKKIMASTIHNPPHLAQVFYARHTFEVIADAVHACLDLGRDVIDGKVPGCNLSELI